MAPWQDFKSDQELPEVCTKANGENVEPGGTEPLDRWMRIKLGIPPATEIVQKKSVQVVCLIPWLHRKDLSDTCKSAPHIMPDQDHSNWV